MQKSISHSQNQYMHIFIIEILILKEELSYHQVITTKKKMKMALSCIRLLDPTSYQK